MIVARLGGPEVTSQQATLRDVLPARKPGQALKGHYILTQDFALRCRYNKFRVYAILNACALLFTCSFS